MLRWALHSHDSIEVIVPPRSVAPRRRRAAATSPVTSPARPTRAGGASAWSKHVVDVLLVLACAGVSMWIHRRSLGAFFSPDDMASIERVRGLIPPHPIRWWRFLSGPGYFAAMLGLVGTNPVPYHAVNLALHGVNVALLFGVVRKWGGDRVAAAVAAAWFGTSPLFEIVVQQAVGVGELLSLGFTLGAFLLADPARPRTWAAAALAFAAALMSKESVVAMPLVLLLPCAGGSLRQRGTLALVLLAPSAALIAGLAALHGPVGGEAYATRFGVNLFHNLMTYTSWVFEYRRLTPDLGGLSLWAWRTGIWIALAAVGIAIATWRTSSRAAAGFVWWLAALAPVLALVHHTYQQYFYTGFGGVAIIGGEGWSALTRVAVRAAARRRGPQADRRGAQAAGPGRRAAAIVVTLAIVALAAHVAAADRLLATRWTRQISGLHLYTDPQVRKSELVRRVSTSLGERLDAPHGRVVFLEPAESERVISVATGQAVARTGHSLLLDTVLDHGLVLRALHPALDSVAIVRSWTPDYRDFDLVVNTFDGQSVDLGRGAPAHVALVQILLDSNFSQTALEDLSTAGPAYPHDRALALWEARTLIRSGRPADAVPAIEALVASGPDDSLRTAARELAAGLVRPAR